MPKLADAKKNGAHAADKADKAAKNGAPQKPAAAKATPTKPPAKAAKPAPAAAVDKELQKFLHAGPRPVIYANVEVARCWDSPPPAEDRETMIGRVVNDVFEATGDTVEEPLVAVKDLLSWLGGGDPAAPALWAAVKACVDGADGIGALTCEQAKALLGWEDEPSFKARAAASAKDAEAAGDAARAAKFANLAKLGFGDEYLLKDEHGNKVRCWNNVNNRDVDGNRMKSHTQVVLRREWAGPSFYPGETVNGETIIITRTGATASAQHRLGGLVLAGQVWAKAKPGDKVFGVDVRKMWPEEPFLESLVVFGISDDPRIIMTIDNVKPRSLADVMTTSKKFNDYDRAMRADATRCLARAIDLLWKRTGAGGTKEAKVFQTHQSSEEFLERHGWLLDCVRHCVELNKERHLNKTGVQPAWCAAAMYLMGTSASSRDRYRDATNQLAFSERALDMTRRDKAKEFLTGIAKMHTGFTPIRNALSKRVAANVGEEMEKLVVLAKAWHNHVTGAPQSVDELQAHVEQDSVGNMVLAEWPGFGGIDNGPDHREVEGRGEEEHAEVQQTAAASRASHLAAMRDAPAAKAGDVDVLDPKAAAAEAARIKAQSKAVLDATRRKEGEPVVRAPGEVRPEPAAPRVDGKPAPAKAISSPAPAKKPSGATPTASKPAAAAKK